MRGANVLKQPGRDTQTGVVRFGVGLSGAARRAEGRRA
jgi:hypothetical protein